MRSKSLLVAEPGTAITGAPSRVNGINEPKQMHSSGHLRTHSEWGQTWRGVGTDVQAIRLSTPGSYARSHMCNS